MCRSFTCSVRSVRSPHSAGRERHPISTYFHLSLSKIKSLSITRPKFRPFGNFVRFSVRKMDTAVVRRRDGAVDANTRDEKQTKVNRRWTKNQGDKERWEEWEWRGKEVKSKQTAWKGKKI